jgi:hypothetical protein
MCCTETKAHSPANSCTLSTPGGEFYYMATTTLVPPELSMPHSNLMSTPFAKDNAAHLRLGMQILLDLGEKYSTSIYTGTEVSSFLELS